MVLLARGSRKGGDNRGDRADEAKAGVRSAHEDRRRAEGGAREEGAKALDDVDVIEGGD
jgi:hypothetical protein